jgi:cysteine sulfinate desulfinase/cysteine desulfurase-like protein
MGEIENKKKSEKKGLIRVGFPRDWTAEQIAAAIRQMPELARKAREEQESGDLDSERQKHTPS